MRRVSSCWTEDTIKTEIRRDLEAECPEEELLRRFERRHPILAAEMTLSEFRALVEEVRASA